MRKSIPCESLDATGRFRSPRRSLRCVKKKRGPFPSRQKKGKTHRYGKKRLKRNIRIHEHAVPLKAKKSHDAGSKAKSGKGIEGRGGGGNGFHRRADRKLSKSLECRANREWQRDRSATLRKGRCAEAAASKKRLAIPFLCQGPPEDGNLVEGACIPRCLSFGSKKQRGLPASRTPRCRLKKLRTRPKYADGSAPEYRKIAAGDRRIFRRENGHRGSPRGRQIRRVGGGHPSKLPHPIPFEPHQAALNRTFCEKGQIWKKKIEDAGRQLGELLVKKGILTSISLQGGN